MPDKRLRCSCVSTSSESDSAISSASISETFSRRSWGRFCSGFDDSSRVHPTVVRAVSLESRPKSSLHMIITVRWPFDCCLVVEGTLRDTLRCNFGMQSCDTSSAGGSGETHTGRQMSSNLSRLGKAVGRSTSQSSPNSHQVEKLLPACNSLIPCSPVRLFGSETFV